MSQLDEFLEQARGEGKLHSAGIFTLDAERANRLLRDYQSADPAYYLMKLVQAAVAGGASEINFTISAEGVEATLFGRDLEFFDTRDILSALTSQNLVQGDDGMSHLAVGLNAALSLYPRRIEWTVWNAWRQETLAMTRTSSEFQRLRERPWASSLPGYRFCLLHQPPEVPPPPAAEGGWVSRLADWLGRGLKGRARRLGEHAQLSERCIYCPIRVTLDGRVLNDPDLWGDGQFAHRGDTRLWEAFVLDGGSNVLGLALPRNRMPENLGQVGYVAVRDFIQLESIGSGVARRLAQPVDWTRGALKVSQGGRPAGNTCFVHHGIILERRTVDYGIPAQVVATTVGLSVDLSQQSVVSNDDLYRRLASIKQIIKRLHNVGMDPNGRFENDLFKWVQPPLMILERSVVPQDPHLKASYYSNGRLQSLSHVGLSGLRLELSEEPGQGHLSSPRSSWPAEPPARDPRGWSRWLQGAIACVAAHDVVTFTLANLPGYLNQQGDGIQATFYESGELRTLTCCREGLSIGWQLYLECGRYAGQVTHAQEEWNERYQDGQVLGPQGAVATAWSTWVESWIENVYRDAQL